MKNKELAIQALRKAPGLGKRYAFLAGEPYCAIGWLYSAIPAEFQFANIYDSVEKFFDLTWSSIAQPNDNFLGTKIARRDYMINFLEGLAK